jgi:hypothetical protein
MASKKEIVDALRQQNIESLDQLAEKAVSAVQQKGQGITIDKSFILSALEKAGVVSVDHLADKAVSSLHAKGASNAQPTVSAAVVHIDI